ncbi:37S ribosomal protein S9, mitochondrial [Smittium culicis]|uniref:37S ribosomal protein S9, mitochondrial n=1 Tax=Smittium culicis TaxID=133412 RepID=A0A1R1YPP8_9FUNG|nr:37S ribosomal protein S9, mitochondrial [Smittium culicis]
MFVRYMQPSSRAFARNFNALPKTPTFIQLARALPILTPPNSVSTKHTYSTSTAQKNAAGDVLPAVARHVPDSAAYFTGNSRLYDLKVGLDKLLDHNRETLGHRVRTGVASKTWLGKDKLEKKLEMPLKKQQYADIIARVSELTRIQLNDLNRSEVVNVVDYFKSEKYTSAYMLAKRKKSLEDLALKTAAGGAASDPTQTETPARSSKNPLVGYKDDLGRFYALGRRKSSSARVWIAPVKPIQPIAQPAHQADAQQPTEQPSDSNTDTGSDANPIAYHHPTLLINGRDLSDYFKLQLHCESVIFPLLVSNSLQAYNVFVIARGGGVTGQAEAAALAIARAICIADPSLKQTLEKGPPPIFHFLLFFLFFFFLTNPKLL